MLPEPLLRAVRRVALRIRAQRALDAAATLAIAGLGIAAATLFAAKLGALADADARLTLALGAALPALAAIAGALRPVPALVAARLLDRAHETRGRLAAALELATQPDADAAWVRAAIDDASAHARALRPAQALPLRAPRDLAPALALGACVGVLGALEIPHRVEVPVPRGITPLLLHEDDVEAFESRVRALSEVADVAPEVREQAQALNRVLEDLADHRIDREETLRRLAEIEARIDASRPADDALVREELRAMGQELRRAALAEQLAEAMREGDAARAELAMRELAERMRREPPSRRELERLRQAFEEAARERSAAEDGEQELAEREEEMQRLLRREEQQSGPSSEREQRLLEQRRRELEQLRREHQERAEARRELERLRRELEEAARDLSREAGQSQEQRESAADAMERAAEDLNRMARQQMTQQQMEDLARQLRELRELVRRQREQQQAGGEGGEGQQRSGGQGGGGRGTSPMDRFVLRARGQGGGEGMPIGAPGGGREGEGRAPGGGSQQGGEGGQGAGAEGSGREGGQSGGGSEEQQMLMLGQGGDATLEIPGLGGSGGEGEGGAGGSGEPDSAAGGAGDEHAPASLDDPTGRGGDTRTVQVQGDARRGPTRSEVIRTAAQRGFASRDYRDHYAEYAEHAEEVIERDQVPPGYRFYVRRYFQLIRPRDGEPGGTSE